MSPGTEWAPGPSGLGGTKDKIRFLPPTQPLASTVLGFLRGHPFEDGPWVTHGIPELALWGGSAPGRPQAPECAPRQRAQRVFRCLTIRWGRQCGASRGIAVPPSRWGMRRPLVPECTPRPRAHRVFRYLTVLGQTTRNFPRDRSPPFGRGMRRPSVPECTPRPRALGGYGFQGFPGYPTWGYLLTAVRVCTAEFGAHQEGLLGPFNGGGSPGLPYPRALPRYEEKKEVRRR